ncbi:MAG: hypothetical protein QCI38_02545, partial [Candidatus Thermoplasmatota archaeon]|nr:hypothetical protein [Candidatus Thermoplasmatota archaeon]
ICVMNRLPLIRKLEDMQSSVFTLQQFSALFGADSKYAAVLLNRMNADGDIVRIMRGKFCLPQANILCVASSIYPPSYISLWKAYEYYGTTTQTPSIIDVVCTDRSQKIVVRLESGIHTLRFINTSPKGIFGIKKENIEGKVAFIAEKEKAVIDGIQYGGRVPLDEVYAAITSGIEVEKIKEYARRTGKQSVLKRVGFLLEKAGYSCKPKELGPLSQTYVALDTDGPRRGKHDGKWRIIDNLVME